MRRQVSEVVLELQGWIRDCGYSPEEIALKAEVDLSTVYRVVDDTQARSKLGAAVKRLCEFAKIPIEVETPRAPMPRMVQDAFLESWDGTREHAVLLARAIRAFGDLTRGAVFSKGRN